MYAYEEVAPPEPEVIVPPSIDIDELYSGKLMNDRNFVSIYDHEVNRFANEIVFFGKFNEDKTKMDVINNETGELISTSMIPKNKPYFIAYSKIFFIRHDDELLNDAIKSDEKRISEGLVVPPMERLDAAYGGVAQFFHNYRIWSCEHMDEGINLIETYRANKFKFNNIVVDKSEDVSTMNIRALFFDTLGLKPEGKEQSKEQTAKFYYITYYLEGVIPEILESGAMIR